MFKFLAKILFTVMLFVIPIVANGADFYGCKEPGEVVHVKILYLNTNGVLTDPTSPLCDVFDPDDTTENATPCGAPVKIGANTGYYGINYTIPASPDEGTWSFIIKGTLDGFVKSDKDTVFVVDTAGECATRGYARIDFSNINGTLDASEIGTDAIGEDELATTASDEIADDVLDEILSDHPTFGTVGGKLNAMRR